MSVGGSETDDQSVEPNEEETLESTEELEVDSEDSDIEESDEKDLHEEDQKGPEEMEIAALKDQLLRSLFYNKHQHELLQNFEKIFLSQILFLFLIE